MARFFAGFFADFFAGFFADFFVGFFVGFFADFWFAGALSGGTISTWEPVGPAALSTSVARTPPMGAASSDRAHPFSLTTVCLVFVDGSVYLRRPLI